MKILVYLSSQIEPLELNMQADQTVMNLKESVTKHCQDAMARQLVYGGSVQGDDRTLSSVCLYTGSSVWLLPTYETDDVGDAKASFCALAAVCGFKAEAVYELALLSNSGGASPNANQHGCSLSLLHLLCRFAQDHSLSTAPIACRHPVWDQAESDAFCWAVEALQTKSPEGGKPPHLTWFGEYGCVLMAHRSNPMWVYLKLVCLDGWSFWEHSGPGASRSHTSIPTADAVKQLPIGQIQLRDIGANELQRTRFTKNTTHLRTLCYRIFTMLASLRLQFFFGKGK